MKANVGSVDRALRLVAGAAIVGAGVYFQSLWGLVGLVPLATGLFRFCPAYTLVGLKTCR